MRRGRIDLWPGYARSLREFLAGNGRDPRARVRPALNRALRPVGARALHLSRAQNRNLFVMKTDTARNLGVTTLSDVARLWPPASD